MPVVLLMVELVGVTETVPWSTMVVLATSLHTIPSIVHRALARAPW